jgi:hypothetical protein
MSVIGVAPFEVDGDDADVAPESPGIPALSPSAVDAESVEVTEA